MSAAADRCFPSSFPDSGRWRRNSAPWYAGHWNASLPPTYTGPEEKEELNSTRNTLVGLAKHLAACNASTDLLSTVLIDNERFFVRSNASDPSVAAWNAAVDRKNNLVYDQVKEFFPKAHVEWFGRGAVRRSENAQGGGGSLSGTEKGGDGWTKCSYFSLREKGDSFGVSLYTLPVSCVDAPHSQPCLSPVAPAGGGLHAGSIQPHRPGGHRGGRAMHNQALRRDALALAGLWLEARRAVQA